MANHIAQLSTTYIISPSILNKDTLNGELARDNKIPIHVRKLAGSSL